MAAPMCSSTSMIFSTLLGSCVCDDDAGGLRENQAVPKKAAGAKKTACPILTSSTEVMRFSTASTTPSLVQMPMAVEPSWRAVGGGRPRGASRGPRRRVCYSMS